jgi:hypothetical protein
VVVYPSDNAFVPFARMWPVWFLGNHEARCMCVLRSDCCGPIRDAVMHDPWPLVQTLITGSFWILWLISDMKLTDIRTHANCRLCPLSSLWQRTRDRICPVGSFQFLWSELSGYFFFYRSIFSAHFFQSCVVYYGYLLRFWCWTDLGAFLAPSSISPFTWEHKRPSGRVCPERFLRLQYWVWGDASFQVRSHNCEKWLTLVTCVSAVPLVRLSAWKISDGFSWNFSIYGFL